jgi:hypothetical protein
MMIGKVFASSVPHEEASGKRQRGDRNRIPAQPHKGRPRRAQERNDEADQGQRACSRWTKGTDPRQLRTGRLKVSAEFGRGAGVAAGSSGLWLEETAVADTQRATAVPYAPGGEKEG